MSDRICPCGKSFTKPSLLKRHQNSKLGCIPYMRTLVSHNTPNAQERTDTKIGEGERVEKASKNFCCKFLKFLEFFEILDFLSYITLYYFLTQIYFQISVLYSKKFIENRPPSPR